MIQGPNAILILAVVIATAFFHTLILVDIAGKPEEVWRDAGLDRTLWMLASLVLLVGPVLYLTRARPKLK